MIESLKVETRDRLKLETIAADLARAGYQRRVEFGRRADGGPALAIAQHSGHVGWRRLGHVACARAHPIERPHVDVVGTATTESVR